MSLPIQLARRPSVWRGNPLSIGIQGWRDRQQKKSVDLTAFGSTWTSQIRTGYGSPLVTSFIVDASLIAQGRITLSLPGSITGTLSEAYYIFDVVAQQGSAEPVTVFMGSFSVTGQVIRSD